MKPFSSNTQPAYEAEWNGHLLQFDAPPTQADIEARLRSDGLLSAPAEVMPYAESVSLRPDTLSAPVHEHYGQRQLFTTPERKVTRPDAALLISVADSDETPDYYACWAWDSRRGQLVSNGYPEIKTDHNEVLQLSLKHSLGTAAAEEFRALGRNPSGLQLTRQQWDRVIEQNERVGRRIPLDELRVCIDEVVTKSTRSQQDEMSDRPVPQQAGHTVDGRLATGHGELDGIAVLRAFGNADTGVIPHIHKFVREATSDPGHAAVHGSADSWPIELPAASSRTQPDWREAEPAYERPGGYFADEATTAAPSSGPAGNDKAGQPIVRPLVSATGSGPVLPNVKRVAGRSYDFWNGLPRLGKVAVCVGAAGIAAVGIHVVHDGPAAHDAAATIAGSENNQAPADQAAQPAENAAEPGLPQLTPLNLQINLGKYQVTDNRGIDIRYPAAGKSPAGWFPADVYPGLANRYIVKENSKWSASANVTAKDLISLTESDGKLTATVNVGKIAVNYTSLPLGRQDIAKITKQMKQSNNSATILDPAGSYMYIPPAPANKGHAKTGKYSAAQQKKVNATINRVVKKQNSVLGQLNRAASMANIDSTELQSFTQRIEPILTGAIEKEIKDAIAAGQLPDEPANVQYTGTLTPGLTAYLHSYKAALAKTSDGSFRFKHKLPVELTDWNNGTVQAIK